MDNEVRLAFDEVILCNYESRELLLTESLTDYLVNIYRLHRSIAAKLLAEPLIDIFDNYDLPVYEDILCMTVEFMYWWSDLD